MVGSGGLGHMGLKLAHALGAHVAAFTRSEGKAGEARKLGADEVILSSDEARMAEHRSSFDLIVSTVSAPQDLDLYSRDRKSAVEGKSVSVRVDLGGGSTIKNKKQDKSVIS